MICGEFGCASRCGTVPSLIQSKKPDTVRQSFSRDNCFRECVWDKSGEDGNFRHDNARCAIQMTKAGSVVLGGRAEG